MRIDKVGFKLFFVATPLLALAFYALNIDVFLGYRRLNPYIFQFLAFTMSFVSYVAIYSSGKLFRTSLKYRFLKHPVVKWFYFVSLFSLFSLLFAYKDDYLSKGLLYLASSFAIILSLLISLEYLANESYKKNSYFLLVFFAIAILSVIVDPIVDFRSVFASNITADGDYDRTRGGGLYLQPNTAGIGCAFLYALIVSRVSRQVALICTLFALVAVFLTFSRSSLFVLMTLIFFAFWRGYLPRFTSYVFIIGAVIFLASISFTDVISEMFYITEGSGYARLSNLRNYFDALEILSDERFYVAKNAFYEFCSAPVLGHGLGYSWYWADLEIGGQGSHNLFLRYMLEYGLVGIFIWPLFLLALFQSRNRDLDKIWVFGICIAAIISAFFSHNIPEQGVILAPLMASIIFSVPNRLKK